MWQDTAVIGVLAAIARWHAHGDPALPLIVFGSTYLLGFTLLLAHTRVWTHCLALGFLWPGLMLPVVKGRLMIALVGAIILVNWRGYRKSLRAFPWQFLMRAEPRLPAKSFWETEIRIAE